MPRHVLADLALTALDVSADGFAVLRARPGGAGGPSRFTAELANPALGRLLHRPGDWSGRDLCELLPDADERGLTAWMSATLADGEPRRLRLELGCPRTGPVDDGAAGDCSGQEAGQIGPRGPADGAGGGPGDGSPDGMPVVVECLLTRLATDPAEAVVMTVRDISELAAGERLLAAAYEMTAEVRATLQTALDSTSDAFAVYDVVRDDGGGMSGLRLVLMNLAGALLLSDGDADDLVGRDMRDFYPEAITSGLWEAVRGALEHQATTAFRLMEPEPSVVPPPGQPGPDPSAPAGGDPGAGAVPDVRAWDNTIAPVGDERVVITWRDVSAEVRRERELAQAHDNATYAAQHDHLTGLANRSLLLEELSAALWASDEDERVGVVFVDLDGFKEVNDRYGHAVGDELLQAVAARLLRIVRHGDTVARVGGDEFVLVLRRLPRDWDAEGFLERAQAAMEEPLLLASGTLQPGASYGIVVSPPASRDLDRLLQLADHEMYQHKQTRRRSRNSRGGAALPA
ncbi:MAG TPA: GGDEF domain-containing protein [Kineosporiaceae bacterium]|nr:GGDEF domain-containing protein [Kineosporiaceae bacterium]